MLIGQEKKQYWLALIVLCSLGLGLYGMFFRPLWVDEFYTVLSTNWRSVLNLDFLRVDVHPPLYSALVGLLRFGRVLSVEDFHFLRLTNLFALPALWVAYCHYKKINVDAARFSFIYFFCSPAFFYYFVELRSYFWLTAFGALAYALYLLRNNTRSNRRAFIAICAVLALTHLFGFFFAEALVFSMLFYDFRKFGKLDKAALAYLILTPIVLVTYYFCFLGISGKTGGAFWIKNNPKVYLQIIYLTLGIIPLSALAVVFAKGIWEKSLDFGFLSLETVFPFVFFFLGIGILTVHSPMVTFRNLLVVAIPLAFSGLRLLGRTYKTRFVYLFLVGIAPVSWFANFHKSLKPYENVDYLFRETVQNPLCSSAVFIGMSGDGTHPSTIMKQIADNEGFSSVEIVGLGDLEDLAPKLALNETCPNYGFVFHLRGSPFGQDGQVILEAFKKQGLNVELKLAPLCRSLSCGALIVRSSN